MPSSKRESIDDDDPTSREHSPAGKKSRLSTDESRTGESVYSLLGGFIRSAISFFVGTNSGQERTDESVYVSGSRTEAANSNGIPVSSNSTNRSIATTIGTTPASNASTTSHSGEIQAIVSGVASGNSSFLPTSDDSYFSGVTSIYGTNSTRNETGLPWENPRQSYYQGANTFLFGAAPDVYHSTWQADGDVDQYDYNDYPYDNYRNYDDQEEEYDDAAVSAGGSGTDSDNDYYDNDDYVDVVDENHAVDDYDDSDACQHEMDEVRALNGENDDYCHYYMYDDYYNDSYADVYDDYYNDDNDYLYNHYTSFNYQEQRILSVVEEDVSIFTQVFSSFGNSEKPELECPICGEEYNHLDLVDVLSCRHTYHQHCLSTWLPVSSTCPHCSFTEVPFPLVDLIYK